MNKADVHLTMGHWQATILGTVLSGLLLASVYQAFQMHDNIQVNTQLAQRNSAAIERNTGDIGGVQDGQIRLRNRMNTLETRVAILDDRMKRARNAVWHVPFRLPDTRTRLVWLPRIHNRHGA